jgi:hypothetical protein
MKDELERIWKETVVTEQKHYPDIFIEGVWTITNTFEQESQLRAGSQTRYVTNTSSERCSHISWSFYCILS